VKTPRFRLDTLCVLILMIALNLGWYRETVRGGYVCPSVFGLPDRGFDVAVLPMVTTLSMGLYLIVFRCGRRTAFLLGFETCGLIAAVAFMVWIRVAPFSVADAFISKPFPGLIRLVRQSRISNDEFLFACSIIETAPQLLAALLGGWLAQRIADRRGKPSATPSRK
jgi:hypothetical protein